MTEANCVVTKIDYPERDHTGSVGRPLANLDMKYVSTPQRPAPIAISKFSKY